VRARRAGECAAVHRYRENCGRAGTRVGHGGGGDGDDDDDDVHDDDDDSDVHDDKNPSIIHYILCIEM
jgi:hypothetical protein